MGGSVESPGISDLSLAASAAVTRNKDGEETAYEAPLSRADVAEGRALWELDPSRGYQNMFVNPAEEATRRNFHIPRKNKEKKGCDRTLLLNGLLFPPYNFLHARGRFILFARLRISLS